MANRRRKFTAEFKSQVALAALTGDRTVAEIAQQYNIHSNMVAQWKKHLTDRAPQLFDRKSGNEEMTDIDALYRKIGRIEMERDFLASRPGIIAVLKRGNR